MELPVHCDYYDNDNILELVNRAKWDADGRQWPLGVQVVTSKFGIYVSPIVVQAAFRGER